MVYWARMVTRKTVRPRKIAPRKKRDAAPRKPLGQIIAEIGMKIPDAEMRKMPTDGAANHDHYIYGTPKQY